jgi:nucleoside 2-deoxyribosyltransferase
MTETTFGFDDFEDDEILDEAQLFDFLRSNSKQSVVSQGSKRDDVATVYLAGPIEAEVHLKNPHSIQWREKIKQLFDLDDEVVWDVRDPNNGKTDGFNYIRNESNEHYYNPYILFRTDLANLSESDFVIVNLSKFVKGFGTPFEMGYAYCREIPIICICEPGVIPEHPFITQSVEAFVYSEEEAVNLIKFMLTEEV